MRNLQDYINKYQGIADNLGYAGESVELLVQLLANASFIGEVENITYMQEASLEKANYINSKIQHCMDNMYSVYRGLCPRVIIKFKPTRYMSFNPYDEITRGTKGYVYYLGYHSVGAIRNNTDELPEDGEFIYGPLSVSPSLEDETYIIIGFLSEKAIPISETISSGNTYYIDCPEDNLSNDVFLKINGEAVKTTRVFAEHILEPGKYVFDLTLPSYGSRLYLANFFSNNPLTRSDDIGITINTSIDAVYYKYSSLESFTDQELRQMILNGVEYVDFNEDFLKRNIYTQLTVGRCFVPEVGRNELNTIHYKASRDRFVNSIIRSNSDIGTVLEETYPDIVKQGGTTSVFKAVDSTASSYQLILYYIPVNEDTYLTPDQINQFRNGKTAYYVVSEMVIQPGTLYNVRVNLDIEVFRNEDISSEVESIIYTYENKFGIDFNSDLVSEIQALISKISNVKRIIDINFSYYDENNSAIDPSTINVGTSYYKLSPVVTLISE